MRIPALSWALGATPVLLVEPAAPVLVVGQLVLSAVAVGVASTRPATAMTLAAAGWSAAFLLHADTGSGTAAAVPGVGLAATAWLAGRTGVNPVEPGAPARSHRDATAVLMIVPLLVGVVALLLSGRADTSSNRAGGPPPRGQGGGDGGRGPAGRRRPDPAHRSGRGRPGP